MKFGQRKFEEIYLTAIRLTFGYDAISYPIRGSICMEFAYEIYF